MKKVIRILSVLLCAALLSGCCMKHEWKPANCEEPAACAKCGETLGNALEHHPGEWETVRLAMWGQDGLKVCKCLICGEVVEEQTDVFQKGSGDQYAPMDIYTIIDRMEWVLHEVSEEYDCVLSSNKSFGLCVTIERDHKTAGALIVFVDQSILVNDSDETDRMIMMSNRDFHKNDVDLDDSVIGDVLLAFLSCTDGTLPRADAEALAADMSEYIGSSATSGSKSFDGVTFNYEVTLGENTWSLVIEEKQ